ncbi:MAG TPA: maleylpyruvate isomerase family mycothiol-dependent enzyme [Propionibacteriaceae bacterium]|nr:maleylpyruvate isomerase family mycothiol-dependent enzyme [Propionibacteriaceae bacterium]
MDSETIWRHIDTERMELANVLESLPQAAWDTPSLCEGWRVRDVGAHLALSHARLRDMVRPAIRSGFRYNAMTRYAAICSPLTHEQIVATLRAFVGSRRRVSFVTELEPLLDILVHSQDICMPLGIDHPMPVDAAVAAANRVLSIRGPMRLWERPQGLRLVASDADWAYGVGEVREAPMQAHLLTLTGRQPPSRSTTAP